MKIIGKTVVIDGQPIKFFESANGINFVFGNGEELSIRIDDEIFIRSIMAIGLGAISRATINLLTRNISIEEPKITK